MRRSLGPWWRRERRAVALVPVALVAVVVGTGSRLDEYWWSRDFHEKAAVVDGWTQIDDEFDDGYLTYPIEAEVRMSSVRRVDEVLGDTFGTEVATGAQLWEVRLAWRADTDVALRGCSFAIIDRDGTRYDAGTAGWNGGSAGFRDKCLPEDAYGPKANVGSTARPTVPDDEEPRPPTWTSTTYVVTADDAVPESVRIWYFLPRYAELAVPTGSDEG